ncbi:u4 tri-snrnp-associated [Diplocarpon rosae]|nr:u4 tri-snrnp-associated [Diplocarpon rosae]
MAEPPHKRARRPDSAQMWEESERRASPRGPRGGERQHGGDRRGERNRDGRYRSRSPRGRDGYERGDGGRDGRERGGDRGGDREREHRSKDGGRETRERLRERSRDRDRARDHERRDAKSRSPRPEREWGKKDIEVDKEPMHEHHDEKLLRNTRIETLPVATQIAAAASDHDHERMHIDTEAHPAKKGKKGKKAAKSIEDEDDLVIEDDGMAAMQAMMGFGGFGTTHQQKVAGNDIYAVRKEKKTEYRQYMNRVGGFNRPLSPSRD